MLLLPLPIPSLHLTLQPCTGAVHRAAAPSPARGRYSHARLHQALNLGLSAALNLVQCFGALSSLAVILSGSPAWQQGSLGCPGWFGVPRAARSTPTLSCSTLSTLLPKGRARSSPTAPHRWQLQVWALPREPGQEKWEQSRRARKVLLLHWICNKRHAWLTLQV